MSKDILLYTQSVQATTQEISALGGRITQQFTASVVVASLPDSASPERLQSASVNPPESLDVVSELAAEAWTNQQQQVERAPGPEAGLSWDAEGYAPPKHIDDDDLAPAPFSLPGDEETPQGSTGTPTSRYMIGSIAVGLVIVSGKDDALVLSKKEQTKVIQEVQEGLRFLTSADPRANISFVYDIQLITVSAKPGKKDSYESAEAPWRNAALKKMGYTAKRKGSVEYVEDLKRKKGTDWAFVAYFTKYPLHHFAYAVQEKLCMHYKNGGWGVNAINSVFAHEVCHIFGAADEYRSACSCGGSHGHLGIPNNNCVNCKGKHVPCLMDANVLSLCQWTRSQLGWDERLYPSSVKLAQAMWTHGHGMQFERPNLRRVRRVGPYVEIEGNPKSNNWFHFAIPTPVIAEDKRLRVGSVMLRFETLSADAIVRDVHIFDGPNRIAVHNGVNKTGKAGFVRFDVPEHPAVRWGIGISVGVRFGEGAGAKVMRFESAGCDFIP